MKLLFFKVIGLGGGQEPIGQNARPDMIIYILLQFQLDTKESFSWGISDAGDLSGGYLLRACEDDNHGNDEGYDEKQNEQHPGNDRGSPP